MRKQDLDSFEYKMSRMELEDLRKMRGDLAAQIERLQGNQRIVSIKTGNLLASKRAKKSLLTQAIAIRENGLQNVTWRPQVGDSVEIRGALHNHSDFSSVNRVMEVGETTVRTTNGWHFYCRHDGWVNGTGMFMRDCPHLNQ